MARKPRFVRTDDRIPSHPASPYPYVGSGGSGRFSDWVLNRPHYLGDHLDVVLTGLSIGDYLRASAGAGSINRTTVGLVASDLFNRADGGAGGDWTDERGSLYEISTNRLTSLSSGLNNLYQTLTNHGTSEYIIQVNWEKVSSDTHWVAIGSRLSGIDGDGQPTSGYYFQFDQNSKQFRLTEVTSGAGTTRIGPTTNANMNQNEWHTMRLVGSGSSTHTLEILYAFNVGGSEVQTVDLTSGGTWGDITPHAGDSIAIRSEQNANYRNFWDAFFICGRNIVMTGLPSGFKVQVDSRTAVSESGGSVTLDVDAWALPATTIKVLNSSGATVATYTPSGGIYGGDVFQFSSDPTAGLWENVSVTQLETDLDNFVLRDGSRAMTDKLKIVADSTQAALFAAVGTLSGAEDTGMVVDASVSGDLGDTTRGIVVFSRQDTAVARNVIGVETWAVASHASGNISKAMIGLEGLVKHEGAGTVDDARGVAGHVWNQSTGTITEAAAFRATAPTLTAGAITNAYGLLVDDQNVGTNKWAIKTGVGLVQFGDKVLVTKAAFDGMTLENTDDSGGNWIGLNVDEYGTGTPFMRMQRSRGSKGTPSAVLSGDSLGIIYFYGHDGTSFGEGPSIQSTAKENFSSTRRGSDLAFRVIPAGVTPASTLGMTLREDTTLELVGELEKNGVLVIGPTTGTTNGAVVKFENDHMLKSLNSGYLHLRNHGDTAYKKLAVDALYLNNRSIEGPSSGVLTLASAYTGLTASTTGTFTFTTGAGGNIQINPASGLGFWAATPIAKPTVTGSRGGNAALASFLTAMANYGLIVDSTTA